MDSGLEGVAGATLMTDAPPTGICGVAVAGDGKSLTEFVLGVAGDFTKRAMAAMGAAMGDALAPDEIMDEMVLAPNASVGGRGPWGGV